MKTFTQYQASKCSALQILFVWPTLKVHLSAFSVYLIGHHDIRVWADNVAYLCWTIPSSEALYDALLESLQEIQIKLLLYCLLLYWMSMWTELNALSVHPSYIYFTRAATVLLHPEVSTDDSCLAFQLSAFHPTSSVSAEQWRLKTCVHWEHCTFIGSEETETPLSKWPAVLCALQTQQGV